ncbi:hypothetical protein SYNPS1DRAFT_28593 [Syncephalis pseudoplumigaleata]|uniref:Uncharacterized protein n=1 Tax=Syncephalis pseudoplumigaleata TaxID=1712513 RepID=A0A4V1J1N5_9FUNG|nr:hypothetical protein SYNPS1DRAFT_28593 [Syncephalis pseudoplumigaleata]|eukprot:RKP25679.1 hypothetical protein SYNPS1DRAFT_28593 [Syncephalis pseudoplumigaleata]
MPPFDYRAFCIMARQYSIVGGEDVWASCARNARVAAQVGYGRTAQTWRVLQLLFSEPPQPSSETSHSPGVAPSQKHAGQPAAVPVLALAQEGSGNASAHCTAPLGLSGPAEACQSDMMPWKEPWNPQDMLLEILNYYGEQLSCMYACMHVCYDGAGRCANVHDRTAGAG